MQQGRPCAVAHRAAFYAIAENEAVQIAIWRVLSGDNGRNAALALGFADQLIPHATASGQMHDHHQRGKLWREREAIDWVEHTGHENMSTRHKPNRT